MAAKQCTKCGELKPLSEYHRMQGGYRPRCKPCHVQDSRSWAVKNHSAYLARMRKWYDENKRSPRVVLTREEKLARKRAYNAIWSAKNKDRFERMRKDWSQKNKHIEMERVRRRQATKRQATPKWADVRKMREIYRLAIQRSKETGTKWSVDHIVPLTSPVVCGLHVEHNLQLLPFSDNVRKSNRSWPDMPE